MSFAKSLSIADEMDAEVGREARALGINLLNGLTRVTPVDTGRARGNWFVGINSPKRSIDPERTAAQAVIEGVNDMQSSKALNYPEIILSNNLPYIERLNDGYSLQAPKKFVESEIDRVVNASNIK